MKYPAFFSFAVFFAAVLASFGQARASVSEEIAEIRSSTTAFLDSLDAPQRDDCQLPFEHENRLDWNYVPTDRMGLSMGRMTAAQTALLDTVLEALHSAEGLEKTKGVIICESVLYEQSGGSAFRDPSKYYLTVYGEPDPKRPWGLRFEGHHLSLNYTFAGDKAAAGAPAFFGANPATVRSGPHMGLRVLEDEEDLARRLVESLSDEQRSLAIFRQTALREIVTRADEEVSPLEPIGLKYVDMEAAQQTQIMSLIGEYLSWMPTDIAAHRLQRLIEAGVEAIRFGWAGSTERGEQHYYRVQGPSFLIEYDNFQGGGTHIHAVWREFEGDFGRDLLKEHYESGHPH